MNLLFLLLLLPGCLDSDAVMCRDVPIDTLSCPDGADVDPSTLYDPDGCAMQATRITGSGSLSADHNGSTLACCYPVQATVTCPD